MKNNIMIKRYRVEMDNGTKNIINNKSFFGTTLMNVEKEIIINNNSIDYKDFNGYQNFNYDNKENNKFLNLTKLKKDNHVIDLENQNIFDLKNNTKWIININIKNILKEYLFAKIKQTRTFKSINVENTKNKNINSTIYDFINYNIINNYKLNYINFYIKYNNIKTNLYDKSTLQYNPIFNDLINNNNYLIQNFNLIKKDDFENLSPVKIIYYQTKNSDEYYFDYYFNLFFIKI